MNVMAHLVAGYPTDELAFAAARGLAEGGVAYFEVQIPFSDPGADGPAIQTASSEVLSRGYRVADAFAFINRLSRSYPGIPAFLMTYANLAWSGGIETFVQQAADAGVHGLIIPDLPFDGDEGLALACAHKGLSCVPVAAPSMGADRLNTLVGKHYPFIYAALRSGITGQETSIDERTISFIETVGASGSAVLGGFGIRTGEQVALLAPHVHAVVAGSVFVNLIRDNASGGADAVFRAVREKAAELTGKKI